MTEEIEKRLSESQSHLSHLPARIRWVRPQSIHLTLKFLGDVERDTLEEVYEITQETASYFRPFSISFRGLGVFPSSSSPKVIWVGVDEGREKVEEIAKWLDARFCEIGFEREKRRFTPHLTLGRIKSISDRVAVMDGISNLASPWFGVMNVERISVMRSRLTPDGPIYTTLREVLLG
jgi:2'-5' RNA ligase